MKARAILTVLALLILPLIDAAGTQTGPRAAPDESLRGLAGVAVVIGEVGTHMHPVGAKADTPSPAQVRAQAEGQLRRAGIPVLDRGGAVGPALHISLVARKDDKGFNHYFVRVWLTQEVILPREPGSKVIATTWETGGAGYGAGFALFERAVCRSVAGFVRAYNEANGRPQRGDRPAVFEELDPCGP